MLSRKVSALLAIIILIAFGTITLETINHSTSDISTSSTGISPTELTLYSPQNGTAIPVDSSDAQINITLSVTSDSPALYIYDISPLNVSALQANGGQGLYSLQNLTHFNATLYPYNYEVFNVTEGKNTTLHLVLYLNSTVYGEMKASDPLTHTYYPYVVEILAETSSGGGGIGFTLLKF